MKISIINGPNLNLLGKREPDVYGEQSFENYLKLLKEKHPSVQFDYFQSNVEGELVNQLQKVGFSYDGVLLNAAGYTHTSVAIADAVKAIESPVLEIHISNIFSREEIRKTSLLSGSCVGVITGLGLFSYEVGCQYFVDQRK